MARLDVVCAKSVSMCACLESSKGSSILWQSAGVCHLTHRTSTCYMNASMGLHVGYGNKGHMRAQVNTQGKARNGSMGLHAGYGNKGHMRAQVNTQGKASDNQVSQQNMALLDCAYQDSDGTAEFEGSAYQFRKKGYQLMTPMEIIDMKRCLGIPLHLDPMPTSDFDIGEFNVSATYLIEKGYCPMNAAELIELKRSCGVPYHVKAMDIDGERSQTHPEVLRGFGGGNGPKLNTGELCRSQEA